VHFPISGNDRSAHGKLTFRLPVQAAVSAACKPGCVSILIPPATEAQMPVTEFYALRHLPITIDMGQIMPAAI
jgi:hypothetical protein